MTCEPRLVWIGLRPRHRSPVAPVDRAEARAGLGLLGDHARRRDSARQLTLIHRGDIEALEAALGQPVDPSLLRRNLLVDAPAGWLRVGHRYVAGPVVLEITGPCAPCGRMREALGEAGYRAMRGRGGVTARLLTGGCLRLGEPIRPLQRDLFERPG